MYSPPLKPSSFNRTNYKRLHPNVQRARKNLAPYVPPRLVSDDEQPKSGVLEPRRRMDFVEKEWGIITN